MGARESGVIQSVLPVGLGEDVLRRIEKDALEQATSLMTARRYLDFEGPIGAGIPSLQVGTLIEHEFGERSVVISARRALTIPTLSASFKLPTRELQGAEQLGLPLPTAPAEDAAESVALAEERLIYHGHDALGVTGMLRSEGVQKRPLLDWSTPSGAIETVIAAADALDAAGAHGPFSLVLSPTLYNALVRKYEGSDVLALDHVRRLATGGIFKSQALVDEAALVSPDVGPLVCAEDMEVRFLSVEQSTLTFVVSESVVLRLDEPEAVCVMSRQNKPLSHPPR